MGSIVNATSAYVEDSNSNKVNILRNYIPPAPNTDPLIKAIFNRSFNQYGQNVYGVYNLPSTIPPLMPANSNFPHGYYQASMINNGSIYDMFKYPVNSVDLYVPGGLGTYNTSWSDSSSPALQSPILPQEAPNIHSVSFPFQQLMNHQPIKFIVTGFDNTNYNYIGLFYGIIQLDYDNYHFNSYAIKYSWDSSASGYVGPLYQQQLQKAISSIPGDFGPIPNVSYILPIGTSDMYESGQVVASSLDLA